MKVVARGNTWHVHFTDTTGQRQRKTTDVRVNPQLPDKGKAMALIAGAEKMRDHLLDGDLPKDFKEKAGKSLNLAFALQRTLRDHWSKQRGQPKQKAYVVGALIRTIGYWPLHSIDYNRLKAFGEELERDGDAPATRNRKMSMIHTALRECFRRGEIERMPEFPHYAENNLKERYLTPEEEGKLLTTLADHTAPADAPRVYLQSLIPFLLDTGLRASECILDGAQDLGDRIWLPHGTTKSGKGRTVPLTKRARAALSEMLQSPVHARLQKLKARDKDNPTKVMGVWFRAACAKAGIEGVTLHTLRHTCASRLVQRGVSLYVVKEWLGHSSITVTERYAHLAPKNLHAAAQALEPNDTQRTPDGTVH